MKHKLPYDILFKKQRNYKWQFLKSILAKDKNEALKIFLTYYHPKKKMYIRAFYPYCGSSKIKYI